MHPWMKRGWTDGCGRSGCIKLEPPHRMLAKVDTFQSTGFRRNPLPGCMSATESKLALIIETDCSKSFASLTNASARQSPRRVSLTTAHRSRVTQHHHRSHVSEGLGDPPSASAGKSTATAAGNDHCLDIVSRSVVAAASLAATALGEINSMSTRSSLPSNANGLA